MDQPFLENVFLIVLTALLTGFGIPYVLGRIEERKLLERKKFDADLVRQSKILEAQSKLLEDLSGLLWKWRYLGKKVVYYGAEKNVERYDLAKKQYDESIWDIINEFRAEISRSRRLVSERAYKRLDSLYNYVVGDVDMQISSITRMEQPDVEKSLELGKRFTDEVSKKLDDAIDDLASELNLKVKK